MEGYISGRLDWTGKDGFISQSGGEHADICSGLLFMAWIAVAPTTGFGHVPRYKRRNEQFKNKLIKNRTLHSIKSLKIDHQNRLTSINSLKIAIHFLMMYFLCFFPMNSILSHQYFRIKTSSSSFIAQSVHFSIQEPSAHRLTMRISQIKKEREVNEHAPTICPNTKHVRVKL